MIVFSFDDWEETSRGAKTWCRAAVAPSHRFRLMRALGKGSTFSLTIETDPLADMAMLERPEQTVAKMGY
ncbi:MAG: hypothetical protein ACYTG0_13645 [Planctomycetota bacterium]